jgi:hypothetical protein
MRALLLLVLAACPSNNGDCTKDSSCGGGEVCARNGECLSSSQVRSIRVMWTIKGQPAGAASCALTPNFYILFASPDPNDLYGYEPVPCAAGVFSIDKLPSRYVSVEMGVDGGFSQDAQINAQGQATFDLRP